MSTRAIHNVRTIERSEFEISWEVGVHEDLIGSHEDPNVFQPS